MTINDPVPPPTPRKFSAAALVGGLVLSLFFGAIGAFFAGLMGMSTNRAPLAFLIGLIPGAIFVAIGAFMKKEGLAQGLIIGGCIIALIGGACGASMVGTSFH
jgi:uncharacterized membrane protein YdjX (TVP38/TMEM64 family)